MVGTGSRHLLRARARVELWVPVGNLWIPVHQIRAGAGDYYVLERHRAGHTLYPHEIAHEANIRALSQLGVRYVIGICAVGSLKRSLKPGNIVLVHDCVGPRDKPMPSPLGTATGHIEHLDMSRPYCETIRTRLRVWLGVNATFRDAGVYMEVTGPRYETPAEVALYARHGADVVGMTGFSEAVAARQLGVCYACLACVTNLGAGLESETIAHDQVAGTMHEILDGVQPILEAAITAGAWPVSCAECSP